MKIQAINMHRIGQRKHCNNESFNTGIMKRRKFIWAICIIICLCNCSKQQDSSVYVVDVSKDYPELKLNIQDIADVTYLKLETDTGYVTKSRPKCISENFVAVNGAGQGEILIFDAHTGSAVSHFANQGNGPHEYLYTNEVHIDEAAREVFIHDSFLRKIFVYDFVNIMVGDEKMLYFRNELDKNKYSTYQLNKAIENKELFKVDNGLYSDVEFVNPLEIILKKYPNAIFTSDSAYYYYDLTDVIPDYFYLATKRSDSRINDKNIKQIFIPNDLFEFGKTQIEVESVKINIYDEERMLVELIRKKNLIPFDYYKEIITNYRKKIDTLDIYKIQEYISYYKNESSLYDTLMREVF